MKKDFVIKLLVTYGLIVIGVAIFPVLVNPQWWHRSATAIQLFIVTVIIRISLMAVQKIAFKKLIVEYSVDFCIVVTEVLFLGWLWTWYTIRELWVMMLIIAIVFVFAYILDIIHINKDIDFINAQILIRKEEKSKECEDG